MTETEAERKERKEQEKAQLKAMSEVLGEILGLSEKEAERIAQRLAECTAHEGWAEFEAKCIAEEEAKRWPEFEAERIEAEWRAEFEAKRIEAERKAKAEAERKKRSKLLAIFTVVFWAAVIIGLVMSSQNAQTGSSSQTESSRIEEQRRQAEEAYWAEEARRAEGVVFTLKNGVKLEMEKIKAGSFLMGSPDGELGRDGDEKHHSVTLTKDYWIGKYEVTQEQWQAEMDSNPSYFKGSNRPVERVSWEDAIEFCRRLNERYAGKLPVINGVRYQFDLPTEAQWEYACRAGTTTSLNSWENIQILGLNNSPNLDKVGWYGGNCGQDFELSNGYDISSWQQRQYSDTRGGTHPVGQKRHNNWGLYDMHGNVFEWCKDWYAKDYPSETVDPVKLVQGNSSDRVCRGGSWYDRAKGCRSAYRYDSKPDNRNSLLGFRLALVPVQ